MTFRISVAMDSGLVLYSNKMQGDAEKEAVLRLVGDLFEQKPGKFGSLAIDMECGRFTVPCHKITAVWVSDVN